MSGLVPLLAATTSQLFLPRARVPARDPGRAGRPTRTRRGPAPGPRQPCAVPRSIPTVFRPSLQSLFGNGETPRSLTVDMLYGALVERCPGIRMAEGRFRLVAGSPECCCRAERRPGAVPVINIDKLFTMLDLRVFAAPPEDRTEVVGPRISSDSDPCLTEALLISSSVRRSHPEDVRGQMIKLTEALTR
jgi:hypothetical protein